MLVTICNLCGIKFQGYAKRCTSTLATNEHHEWVTYDESQEQATRTEKGFRFDILDASFLRAMAQVANLGAKKYGDLNWQKSRMHGHAAPLNHILDHSTKYLLNEPYDHANLGTKRKYHLAAIAFNAMMEYWYEEHFSGSDKDSASNP